MAETPLKRIRVDDNLWDAFGEASEAIGLDRTKVLVAFMRRFVRALAVSRMDDTDQGTDPPR